MGNTKCRNLPLQHGRWMHEFRYYILIACNRCGNEGNGETDRALCIPIKEHLDGKLRARLSIPLGTHRIQNINGRFWYKSHCLVQDAKTPTRQGLEALWTNTKNPRMNSRRNARKTHWSYPVPSHRLLMWVLHWSTIWDFNQLFFPSGKHVVSGGFFEVVNRVIAI